MAAQTGVLLLHGLTGMPSEMRPVEKYLARLGFETEAALLSGHGGGHKELIAASWRDWLASASEALQRLLAKCDQVVICGLSMGSSIASILAASEDRVAGVILLSPTLSFDGSNLDNLTHQRPWKSKILRDIAHVACMCLPALGETLYWTETPPYGLKDVRLQRQITRAIEAARRGEDTEFGLFRTYFASLCQMNLLTDEFRRTARKVSCPAMIVSSLEDTLAQLYNATDTYELLGSQDKSLYMLTGCDHVVTLDLMRHYVCRLVGQFMERVTGVKDTISRQDIKSGVTLELHNNPHSSPLNIHNEFSRDASCPADLLRFSQTSNLSPKSYHSLLARLDQETLFSLPLFTADCRLSDGMSGFPGRLASLCEKLLPGLLRPSFLCLSMPEEKWGELEGSCHLDSASVSLAWQLCSLAISTLADSFHTESTVFVDLASGDIEPGARHFTSGSPLASWLLYRANQVKVSFDLNRLGRGCACCVAAEAVGACDEDGEILESLSVSSQWH